LSILEKLTKTRSANARDWALAFDEAMKENNWKIEDIDPALMTGWFANYWAAVNNPLQEDIIKTEHKVEALEQRLVELESADSVIVIREILVDISETLDIGVARALARKALEAQQPAKEQGS
jgi:threonine synthase